MKAIKLISPIIIAVAIMGILTVHTTAASTNAQSISSSGEIVPINGLRFLHTEAKWIKDSIGNTIILKGANFQGYEFGAFNSHSEEDYAKMASWGFNVVRLPLAWHYIEPEPGVYNLTYLETSIERDLSWAKKYGIYIILDANHVWHWSPYWEGEGIPTWMVSGYSHTEEGKNTAMNDFWLGKGPNGTQASQLNPSMQDRFVVLWNFLAARYKNESAIAAYDLFNEPGEGSLLPFEQQGTYLYPFYERIINSIRSVDTQHIITVEPDSPGWYWHSQYVQKYILNKSNIVLSIHFYRFSLGTTYNPSNLAELQNDFTWDNPQTNPARNWTIPVWVGEFGKGADESNAGLWLRDSINIFSNYQVGWAYWTYGKNDYDTKVLLYSNGNERTLLTNELKLK